MSEHRPKPDNAVTLAEAAKLLGISTEAVRQRVKRGTLRSWKGNQGRMVALPEPEEALPLSLPPDERNATIARLSVTVDADRKRIAALEAERDAAVALAAERARDLAAAEAVAVERLGEIERLHQTLRVSALEQGMEPPTFAATLKAWLAKRLGTV